MTGEYFRGNDAARDVKSGAGPGLVMAQETTLAAGEAAVAMMSSTMKLSTVACPPGTNLLFARTFVTFVYNRCL